MTSGGMLSIPAALPVFICLSAFRISSLVTSMFVGPTFRSGGLRGFAGRIIASRVIEELKLSHNGKMAGIEKIREAESCTKDFNTRVSAPGVLENNKVVIIDMDEVYNIGSKVQYLKEFFINALELPGTLTEYRLFGVKEEKEREIDENTTIDDIYKYVLTGSFIMKKMPKQG
ncbi:uncharacterized protein LOC106068495 isoform X2 [Biomphalaria glabrata]|uniref:Uncharacterized protein LOC106068495 isoform X2 n=1 Tax=Biomphalaria glabrata TaxID=6526 RepID=A0A9W2YUX5_BIOGL|nr:uncharacterized protein LOC106068495 isoform X2 [Biomphalaria glabrata]